MIKAEIVQGGRFFRRRKHLIIAGKRVLTVPSNQNEKLIIAQSAANEMRAALGSAVEPLVKSLLGKQNPEIAQEIMELFDERKNYKVTSD